MLQLNGSANAHRVTAFALFTLCLAAALSADVITTGNVTETWGSTTNGQIGEFSDGTMLIDGGSEVLGNWVTIGRDAFGSLEITGLNSRFLAETGFSVGESGGEGIVEVVNGGELKGSLTLGSFSGAASAVFDGSGTMVTGGGMSVGTYGGQGEMSITNSAKVIWSGGGNLGGGLEQSSGSVLVNGEGALLQFGSSGTFTIGSEGAGKLYVTAGADVENGSAKLATMPTGKAEVVISGAGSTWTNNGVLQLGIMGEASLKITGGATVTVADQTYYGPRGTLIIDVDENTTFTTNGFSANGTVSLTAQAGVAPGIYTPIVNNGAWDDASVTYKTFGGRWDAVNHQFIVEASEDVAQGEQARINLRNTQCVGVGNELAAGFLPTDQDSEITFRATTTSGQVLDVLKNLAHESVIKGSYDFDVTGLNNSEVMLHFKVDPSLAPEDISIWHYYDEATGWTEYSSADLLIRDGWASFTVDSFSSYAVTAVPEPMTLSVLGFGAMALLRRKRK